MAHESSQGRRGLRLLPFAAVVAWGFGLGVVPLIGGPPNGDDAYYHAMRAQQQARCWLLGVVYPRWYPDLNAGLGGPEPRAYPLVPLVILGVLALATGDGIAAISFATAIIPAVAGVAMMVALRRRGVGIPAALFGAAAWAAAPYLLIALHERAALAEALALAVLPLALEASLPPQPGARGGLLRCAVLQAILLATQVPVAVMAGIVAFACRLARGRAGRPAELVLACGLGSCLAAASWLPNVASVWRLQGESLTGPGYRWQDHLLPFGAGSDATLAVHLCLALAGTAALLVVATAAGPRVQRPTAGAGLVTLALATPLLGWLHGLIPGLAFLQFPWRWIGIAGCLGVMAIASAGRTVVRTAGLVAFMLPLAVPFEFRWRLPAGPPMRPSDPGTVTARAATRFGVPPILPSLPAYLPRGVDLRAALAAAGRARQEVRIATGSRPGRIVASAVVPSGGSVLLPVLADEGWRVEVDGHRIVWSSESSLVAVPVAARARFIVADQALLAEDLAGVALSLVSVASLAGLALRDRRRRKEVLSRCGSSA